MGFLFAFLGMFGYGLSNGISRVLAREVPHFTALFWAGFLTLIGLFGLASVQFLAYSDFVPHLSGLVFALLAGLFGFVGNVFLFRGLLVDEVSVVAPIATSYALSTSLFSYIFFGQTFALWQLGLLCVTVLGIFLIGFRFSPSSLSLRGGVLYGFGTLLFWGMQLALGAEAALSLGGPYAAFFMQGSFTLLAFLFVLFFSQPLSMKCSRSVFVAFCVSSLGNIGGVFGSNMAFLFLPAGIAAAVLASSPVVALTFARYYFYERLTVLQLFGALLVVMSLIVLSLLS